MNLDLADLKLLSTVARHLSFRMAAQELDLSASAVSHAVRSIEERLGVRMFSRTTRSVALTPAGRQLLDRVGPALQDIAAAIDGINDFRDTPQGLLRINAPRPAGELVLGPLVAEFLTRHPKVEVELVLDDGFVDIVEGGFDAGVRLAVGTAAEVQADPAVQLAYLGEALETEASAPRDTTANRPEMLGVGSLVAGYGAEPVLHGIDLQVRRGEVVALLGANGAGKSTLMKALAGLHRPVQGGIHLVHETEWCWI